MRASPEAPPPSGSRLAGSATESSDIGVAVDSASPPGGGRPGGGRRLAPSRWGRTTAALIAVVVTAASAESVSGQERLRAECAATAAPQSTRDFCELAAHAVEALEARLGIVQIGGNPVPGTASPFGEKIGPIPRFGVSGRLTLAGVELPPIESVGSTATPNAVPVGLNVDAGVGIFPGFPLVPTVGGLLAVDVLASAGITLLPDSDGFDGGQPFSWALGTRLGITRESFTAPGISITAMYRRFGDVTWGDGDLVDTDAFVRLDGRRAWSLRGAVSKRIASLGVAGGAGWDFYSADARVRVTDSDDTAIEAIEDGVSTSRFTAFANAAFTTLILNFVGELGWQADGDSPTLPAGDVPGQGGIYGGLAVRVAI